MSQVEEPVSIPPPTSESSPQQPSVGAIAYSKPLLNPLQSEAPPPSSTLVEPPKSPNSSNPATDDKGNATVESVNGTAASHTPPAPAEAPGVVVPTSDPAPSAEAPASAEQAGKSPLPPDATVPPTPRAEDEAPPTLPPDAIPPAVPTPTVITTNEQEAKGGILGVEEPASLPTPGPEEIAQPSATASQEPAGEPMDVDVEKPAENPPAVPALQSSQSDGSLKRSGDSLDDGRDEKRMKEDSISAATPVPAPTSQIAPNQSTTVQPESSTVPSAQAPSTDGAPPPTPAWVTYQPPAPRPSGPTTPLTLHQHKHLLNAVRALKKKPDAMAFLHPVDGPALGIPHYANVIDSPMDLGTAEIKLVASDPRGPPKDKSKAKNWDTSKGSYSSYSELVGDVRQIWENTRKFNGPHHTVTVSADKLDIAFESALSKIPPEPVIAPPPPPIAARVATPPAATPVAGPSSARRASISQPPTIRRSSDDTRPKREIHPPPSKDLAYEEIPGSARKPKRRNDPQLQWGLKVIKSFETVQKFYPAASPFLFPVSEIIKAIPDYTSVIKKPIDLLIIKEKLENGDYDEVNQVDNDIRLMVNNALKFNPPGDPVSIAANQLLQIWIEKWQSLPPKQEVRDSSEDPLADNYEDEGYHSEEDTKQLKSLEAQVSSLNDQIFDLRTKIAKSRSERSAKPAKPKHAKSSSIAQQPRKQSNAAKHSPGVNGNGHGGQSSAKKSKKSKEINYRDEDDDMESEDEQPNTITLTQKQELAEKIQEADGDTLQQAIIIIQQTTNLGSNNEEIELDIDSLPIPTQIQLYNLVCKRKIGGSKPRKSAGSGPSKKQSKKAGGTKRGVNEREEAERIRRMEAQLQSFDSRQSGGVPATTYEEGESSSEEESSDEE
ncbi:uncharacterized protein I206_100994 [Kwoniella pini CBS 10737]|uniref:Bromodomain-containing factor 1 n=1 Tax=Kwoniella pini CBS 10737 TaxID=1296096 RepID=A0A1B9ICB5_9TREE|nr:uncharacterized protein I206_00332 [Kwoniella pini CBS 10737]OCF53031.1 hypothetical protein I206_00332 [Kwoniella pini CBS 10737]